MVACLSRMGSPWRFSGQDEGLLNSEGDAMYLGKILGWPAISISLDTGTEVGVETCVLKDDLSVLRPSTDPRSKRAQWTELPRPSMTTPSHSLPRMRIWQDKTAAVMMNRVQRADSSVCQTPIQTSSSLMPSAVSSTHPMRKLYCSKSITMLAVWAQRAMAYFLGDLGDMPKARSVATRPSPATPPTLQHTAMVQTATSLLPCRTTSLFSKVSWGTALSGLEWIAQNLLSFSSSTMARGLQR
mmetsp:Transcript_9162/g.27779  ORF Transcript_9162/g.27779 Transcript_9162/m.27779 type:complete len:242 (+) Transcript_9162:5087-5812(+)